LVNEESGCDDFVRAALLFLSFGYECACQLKGSDHGGCDTAVELALAGIDISNIGWLLQPADFGASPIRRAALYTHGKMSQRVCAKAGTSRGFGCGIKVVPFVFLRVLRGSSSLPRPKTIHEVTRRALRIGFQQILLD
jgi:hypothetical protein